MSPDRVATKDDLRRDNRARVLRRVHQRGPVNRSDLVAYTGLNRSTIGVLVSELVERGLLRETAGTPGQVGRPSRLVEPVVDSAVVIAIDIRVDMTVMAVVGLGGRELSRSSVTHDRRDYPVDRVVGEILDHTRDAVRELPADTLVTGLAISVPGAVDRSRYLVRAAPNLDWFDVALGDALQQAWRAEFGSVPRLCMGNDADLGALAEHMRGLASRHRSLLYVSSDVGIGGGVILDDRLMIGPGGYGAELGHMRVNPEGRMCTCGAEGCWETEIGSDAILRAAGRAGQDSTVADVIDAAASGESAAKEAVQRAGRWLGLGLANLINLFNPEAIVLGGHLGEMLPHVTHEIHTQVRLALPAAAGAPPITPSALGADSALIGSSEAAFESLMADPWEVLVQAPTVRDLRAGPA